MRVLVVSLVLAACGSAAPAPSGPGSPAPSTQLQHAPDDIPLPPPLAAVPDPSPGERGPREPSCDDPGVHCKCPSPPDIQVRACWAVMPCPTPPDRRVRACKLAQLTCTTTDPNGPNDCLDTSIKPVVARVIASQLATDMVITIGVGSNQGVTRLWRGTLLRGDTDEVLPGGAITILRVDNHVVVAKVHVSNDVLQANPRVRLSAE